MSHLAQRNVLAAYLGLVCLMGTGLFKGCDLPDIVPDIVVPEKTAKHAVIIRETEDDTPALARLWTGLRTDPAAAWIKDNGYTLDIEDDDADEPYMELVRQASEGKRALVMLGNNDKDAVAVYPIDQETTPDNVVEWMRRHGE